MEESEESYRAGFVKVASSLVMHVIGSGSNFRKNDFITAGRNDRFNK